MSCWKTKNNSFSAVESVLGEMPEQVHISCRRLLKNDKMWYTSVMYNCYVFFECRSYLCCVVLFVVWWHSVVERTSDLLWWIICFRPHFTFMLNMTSRAARINVVRQTMNAPSCHQRTKISTLQSRLLRVCCSKLKHMRHSERQLNAIAGFVFSIVMIANAYNLSHCHCLCAVLFSSKMC